jgi:hypothetical protein
MYRHRNTLDDFELGAANQALSYSGFCGIGTMEALHVFSLKN